MFVAACQFFIPQQLQQEEASIRVNNAIPKVAAEALSRNWGYYNVARHIELNTLYTEQKFGAIAQEIVPNLFLGSIRQADSLRKGTAVISEKEGKKVLSCDGSGEIAEKFSIVACLNSADTREVAGDEKHGLRPPENKSVPEFFVNMVDDGSNANELMAQLDLVFSFIEKQLAEGRKVLFHCRAGQSRSATILAAYLMKKNDWTRNKALNLIADCRPIIYPFQSFLKMLFYYEWNLKPIVIKVEASVETDSESESEGEEVKGSERPLGLTRTMGCANLAKLVREAKRTSKAI